jgi:hypothetical protein
VTSDPFGAAYLIEINLSGISGLIAGESLVSRGGTTAKLKLFDISFWRILDSGIAAYTQKVNLAATKLHDFACPCRVNCGSPIRSLRINESLRADLSQTIQVSALIDPFARILLLPALDIVCRRFTKAGMDSERRHIRYQSHLYQERRF